jgi:hypothetical protein
MDLSHVCQFQNAFFDYQFYSKTTDWLIVEKQETKIGLTSVIFTGKIGFQKFNVEVGSKSAYVRVFNNQNNLVGDRRCDTPDELIEFMNEVLG